MSTTTQRPSRHSMNTVPEFYAETPQATASEGLAQGPYMAARAGVKPMTLRTKHVDSTNAPHTPHIYTVIYLITLSPPRVNTLTMQDPAFSGIAPSILNSLPLQILLLPKSSKLLLCKLLKTDLFHRDWTGSASE